jgi:hypothetical protein
MESVRFGGRVGHTGLCCLVMTQKSDPAGLQLLSIDGTFSDSIRDIEAGALALVRRSINPTEQVFGGPWCWELTSGGPHIRLRTPYGNGLRAHGSGA